MEKLIQGYCCVLNGARTVMAEREEGADCDYPNCPFRERCPIASELRDFLETTKEKAEA